MAASACTLFLHGAGSGLPGWNPSRQRHHSVVLRVATAALPSGGGGGGGGGKSEKEESKAILNAFFLGKALADSVNERVSSAVGEVLSQIGRRQAQQQKEIREFQEEVENRARQFLLQSQQQKKRDEEP